jgi:hypothetical protein
VESMQVGGGDVQVTLREAAVEGLFAGSRGGLGRVFYLDAVMAGYDRRPGDLRRAGALGRDAHALFAQRAEGQANSLLGKAEGGGDGDWEGVGIAEDGRDGGGHVARHRGRMSVLGQGM